MVVLAVIVGVLVSNCNCNYKNDAQYDLGKHSVYFAAGNNVPTTEVYSKKHDSEKTTTLTYVLFLPSVIETLSQKRCLISQQKVYLMRK